MVAWYWAKPFRYGSCAPVVPVTLRGPARGSYNHFIRQWL
jgi:hypothetical protein